MDTARWATLKELYERAADLAPKERSVLLERLRADDPEAAAELAILLESSQEAESFFDGLADRVLSRPPWHEESPADGDDTQPEEVDARIGTSIRQYAIEELLGSGGMGVVYRARDTFLNRTVALKFLPPHRRDDEAAIKRFMVEARAAAALDHPNICNIHEVAEDDDGRLFISMAFYEGESLRRKIARGPLPIEESLDYARQVAAGLEEAHTRDVIHRDIKPGNVIVTPGGVAKIVDFGLAKLSDVTLTGARMTIGTLAYMPPEQASEGPVDHRMDLWSLGVVMYEMLTGSRPFTGDGVGAVVHAILNREPEPVRALRAEVPAEVEAVVMRLLAKEPKARFASAAAVLEALEAAEVSESRSARRGPHVRGTRLWKRWLRWVTGS